MRRPRSERSLGLARSGGGPTSGLETDLRTRSLRSLPRAQLRVRGTRIVHRGGGRFSKDSASSLNVGSIAKNESCEAGHVPSPPAPTRSASGGTGCAWSRFMAYRDVGRSCERLMASTRCRLFSRTPAHEIGAAATPGRRFALTWLAPERTTSASLASSEMNQNSAEWRAPPEASSAHHMKSEGAAPTSECSGRPLRAAADRRVRQHVHAIPKQSV